MLHKLWHLRSIDQQGIVETSRNVEKPGALRRKVAKYALPGRSVRHPSVWTGRELARQKDWLVQLEEAVVNELVDQTRRQLEKPFVSLSRSDFPLPKLGPLLADCRNEILHGRGFVQFRGIPADAFPERFNAMMLWALGLHLGDSVASQNRHGDLLGSVRNLGQSVNNPAERGPYSNDRIPWHVDSCDMVGLMCLKPALEGGASSLASSTHIYNRLLETRPDLADALTRPLYRDRRDEVPASKPPWYALPVFNFHGGLLSVSIEPTYIGSVARHFDHEPNDALQIEGVAAVQAFADEHRLDIEFQSGDIQFLNNYTIMHTRQGFRDAPEPENRRHLLRLWLLNDDGRAVGDAYYDRHGNRTTVQRPGGIIGADTQVQCPYDADAASTDRT